MRSKKGIMFGAFVNREIGHGTHFIYLNDIMYTEWRYNDIGEKKWYGIRAYDGKKYDIDYDVVIYKAKPSLIKRAYRKVVSETKRRIKC